MDLTEMKNGIRCRNQCRNQSIFICFSLLLFWERVSAQIKYSVQEEKKVGSIVGNIAKDIGLDINASKDRRFRIVSASSEGLFKVNEKNGLLTVVKKNDREQICDVNSVCLMNLKVVVENPLEVHFVEVEITDINDHSPTFVDKEQIFEIPESALAGEDFQMQAAQDPDFGINSVRFYKLSQTEHFELEFRGSGEEQKIPVLKLSKSLDREQQNKHNLVLTAIDGGNPPRSGSININIIVLDDNDNRPKFTQELYSVTLQENSNIGYVVVKVNATDLDEGQNGEIVYSFVKNLDKEVYDAFALDKITGEIRVQGVIDFEIKNVYRVSVSASDKGQPPKVSNCKVLIKVEDVNDNQPEIDETSVSDVVPENSNPGTVISLIGIIDKDSGINGKVVCRLSEDVPFILKPSFKENLYSLVTSGSLDRELISYYEITIIATDLGQPPLSSIKTVRIEISDVNDNSPYFLHNPVEVYLVENNPPGGSILSIQASDKDLNENAIITYQLIKEGVQNEMSSLLNINSETGVIHALKAFDFETVKTIQFHVAAFDSGTPSLSCNVTVKVFILDQNDNAPVILYPVSGNGSAEVVEEIYRNVNAGHLVTKVCAYDADIGYNGWLLFSLQKVSDHSLFGLDRYTGQIRTLRSFTETDKAEHKLVILVKDNGNISLSATASVIVKVVESKESFEVTDVRTTIKDEKENNSTPYLIITLGSVSMLFIISIVVLIAMQCSKTTDCASNYLQETTYDGTLCHSIQYRSGDKRYMLVGPRMSIGSTIISGNNGNTLVIPDRKRQASGEVRINLITLTLPVFLNKLFVSCVCYVLNNAILPTHLLAPSETLYLFSTAKQCR